MTVGSAVRDLPQKAHFAATPFSFERLDPMCER
jgi:hypothetical protein